MLDQRPGGGPAAVSVEPHRPDVVGRDHYNRFKEVVTRSTAGAGEDLPTHAVPVLDQRLLYTTAVMVVPHRPDVIGRNSRHIHKEVVTWPGTGARHDTPTRAVPVLDQRLPGTVAVLITPRCPDVVARDGRQTGHLIVIHSTIGAGDNLPTRAIPVLDQCLLETATVYIPSHRPDVVERDRYNIANTVVTRPDIGAGDNLPTRAIPVLDQRLIETATVMVVSHRPDVVGRDGYNIAKDVVTRSDVGAGDNASGCTSRHRGR